jgi:beta-alanine--pyruvate transaminase
MKPVTHPTSPAQGLMMDNHWLPFTANRSFKEHPRILSGAKGVYYKDDRGNSLLDCVSGLFCTPAGHGREEIISAVTAQMRKLDFNPPFQFSHPDGFKLAEAVARLTPGDLDRVFFVNSGSEAVETALKMALAYHHARGEGGRTRLIGRERAYHGVNFGGLAVSGMVRNKEAFGAGLPGVSHMRHTWSADRKFTPGQSEAGADLADDLQRAVDLYGAASIAAVIVEPISGSTGILVPPKGYLNRLRQIATRHGILLIFDEVITGFGRTGKAFGAHTFDVTPDIITMAKALTNGSLPMGAVAARRDIYDTITTAAAEGAIEFFHGYTYSAHPASTAAALATLEIYEQERLFERSAKLSIPFQELVFSLKDLPIITDIRSFGLLAGIDLAADKKPGQRGFAALNSLFESGFVVRVTADTIILAPPFVAEESHLQQMIDGIRKTISRF